MERNQMFSVGGAAFWGYPYRLIIYSDGIETREFFNAYFIPYPKILMIELENDSFSREIIIHTDLPGVPSRISFFGGKTDEILSMIKLHSKNTEQADFLDSVTTEEKMRSDGKDRLDKSLEIKTEKGKFSLKLVILCILVEVLCILSTGPAIIAWKKITHNPNNNRVALYSVNEYAPLTSSIDEYFLVQVNRGENGKIISETFYKWDGEVLQAVFRDGKVSERDWSLYAFQVFLAFAQAGILLLMVGHFIYKPLFYCGVALFVSWFVIAPIFMFFE